MVSHQISYWREEKTKSNILVTLIIFTTIILGVFYYKSWSFNIVERLFDYVDDNCRVNDECLVDMKKAINFEWDFIYVIDKGAERKDIEKYINLKIDEDLDMFSKIIFIKNNKILHIEEYLDYTGDDDKRILNINFDYRKSGTACVKYYRIPKSNSSILIKKIEFENSKANYLFSSINEEQIIRCDSLYN
jgi:hypothetical protein